MISPPPRHRALRLALLTLTSALLSCSGGTTHQGASIDWDTRGNDGALMVRVPAGPFVRGSSSAELRAAKVMCRAHAGEPCAESWFSSEAPQREINLDAFWIDRAEVSMRQYERCLSAGACGLPAHFQGVCQSWVRGRWQAIPRTAAIDTLGRGTLPVTCVSWRDAEAYCAWAGKRLPTEAEWEKAARGTDGRVFPWGNAPPTCDHAIYHSDQGQGCGRDGTASVGQRPEGASPYGVLDMAGNAAEWVVDVEDPKFYEAAPANAPVRRGEPNANRVIRGGSWSSRPSMLRAANRGGFNPEHINAYTGFRCAMDD